MHIPRHRRVLCMVMPSHDLHHLFENKTHCYPPWFQTPDLTSHTRARTFIAPGDLQHIPGCCPLRAVPVLLLIAWVSSLASAVASYLCWRKLGFSLIVLRPSNTDSTWIIVNELQLLGAVERLAVRLGDFSAKDASTLQRLCPLSSASSL